MRKLCIIAMTLFAAGLLSGSVFGFTLEPAQDMTDSSWWEYKTPDDGVSVQLDRQPTYVKFSLREEAGEYSWSNVARNNWNSVGICRLPH